MKFPVTETWQNAYTLSCLAPGSELAVKPSVAAVYVVIGGSQPTIQPHEGDDIQPQTVSAEIVLIEGDVDLPVQ